MCVTLKEMVFMLAIFNKTSSSSLLSKSNLSFATSLFIPPLLSTEHFMSNIYCLKINLVAAKKNLSSENLTFQKLSKYYLQKL